MKRTWIKTKDKAHWLGLRAEDMTSTEVPALYNLSPYTTVFEVWHANKNGDILTIDENDRMKWGNRLEEAIAKGVAEDHGWEVAPLKEYCRLDGLRMGCSFDYVILEGGEKKAILEIKNVDAMIYREGWEVDEDGDVEAPAHIEMQVQYQMLISGIDRAYIAALVGGNEVALLEREADKDVHASIMARVEKFWQSIDNNAPPKPNFELDAEFISKLYGYAEPNKIADPTERIDFLAVEYKREADLAKAHEKQRKAIKAEILTLIGEAEKCKGNQYSISAKTRGPVDVAYTKEGYRDFRISWKKTKTSPSG